MGVGLRKKPKDLSASEREEHEHGEGVGVYATLLQTIHIINRERGKKGKKNGRGKKIRKRRDHRGGMFMNFTSPRNEVYTLKLRIRVQGPRKSCFHRDLGQHRESWRGGMLGVV